MMYGPSNDNGIWRTRYYNELCTMYDELDVVRVRKSGRLKWPEHLFRMQEVNPCRKLTIHKPEGISRVGKPGSRYLESVEEDLKDTDVRYWRRKSHEREQWRRRD